MTETMFLEQTYVMGSPLLLILVFMENNRDCLEPLIPMGLVVMQLSFLILDSQIFYFSL